MLRHETRVRARALQLLYTLETGSGDDVLEAREGLARLTHPGLTVLDDAEQLAYEIMAQRGMLDARAEGAAENWRIERMATVERNILRLGIHELLAGDVPPKVVIDEALWLAHRFSGPRATSFINGVLDRVARDLGRL